MDNAYVIDGVLAAVLLCGTLFGAYRGLFKTLMSLAVVIVSIVGSLLIANALAGPMTDFIAPKLEQQVVQQFSDKLNTSSGDTASQDETKGSMTELLERYGVSGSVADGLRQRLTEVFSEASASARETVVASFRSAISAGLRSMVFSLVTTVLVFVSFLVLTLTLTLLTNTLNHLFDLPVLGTVNRLGGGLIGLMEAALLLYVILYLANLANIGNLSQRREASILLPLFLNHSPVELVSSLMR